jgi:signal transduction histidine kinase
VGILQSNDQADYADQYLDVIEENLYDKHFAFLVQPPERDFTKYFVRVLLVLLAFNVEHFTQSWRWCPRRTGHMGIDRSKQKIKMGDIKKDLMEKKIEPDITGAVAGINQKSAQKLYGVVEDISERKNNELSAQDFLAIVSHDLRSPLSVIKLYMQLCSRLAVNIGNDPIAGMLKKAELQIHKMNRMIECYLDSSVTVAGKTKLFPLMFDIRALLKEVIDDLYLLHPGQIIFLKPSTRVEVYADREKIVQVVQNLLSNAIKYSSRSDVITVYFKKMADYLQVAIEDHGIGIKAADQEKIFDRFHRVDCENGTVVKGYGLGLYLSSEIIKQHKGNIWLESEISKGSRFYFTLPLP